MRLLIACATLAVMSGSSLAAMTSEITPFGQQCRDIADGAGSGQDFVLKACSDSKRAITYLLYNEGTRLSVGFGQVPHTAVSGLSTERQDSWPIQWIGTGEGDTFQPKAAIVRFVPLGETANSLYVFRLLDNGLSCLAGTVGAGKDQNQKAVALAEEAVAKTSCESEPTKLEP